MSIRLEASQFVAIAGIVLLAVGIFVLPVLEVTTAPPLLEVEETYHYADLVGSKEINVLILGSIAVLLTLSGWTKPLWAIGLASLGVVGNDFRLALEFTSSETLFFNTDLLPGAWLALFSGSLLIFISPFANQIVPWPRLYRPLESRLLIDQKLFLLLGSAGVLLLGLGVFLPIYDSAQVLSVAAENIGAGQGEVTYFYDGEGGGVYLLIIAIITLIALALRQYEISWLMGIAALGILANEFRIGSAYADIFEAAGSGWLLMAGGMLLLLSTGRLMRLVQSGAPEYRYLDPLRPGQNLIRTGVPVGVIVFLGGFVLWEFEGLWELGDFLADALGSSPSFVQDTVTYFGEVPADALFESLLVGAVFGGLSTALIYLSGKGWLKWPRIPAVSVWGAIGHTLMLTLIFEMGLLPAIGVGVLFFVTTAYIREPEVRRFFRLKTLKPLADRQALSIIAVGLLIGSIVGAISGQILLYPTEHCTYSPDSYPNLYRNYPEGYDVQARMGLGLTIVSTLILLVPAWTLLNRKPRRRDESSSGFFRNPITPYLFLLPTLLFLLVFLYYPSVEILQQSLNVQDRSIQQEIFVCMENYVQLTDGDFREFNTGGRTYPGNITYINSVIATFSITTAIVIITMACALGVALLAAQKIRGASIYRTLLIWPYAISPIVTGVIFLAMFREGSSGVINWALSSLFDTQPKWLTNEDLAPWVIIFASVWNALGFNILFYIAGLQNIPKDVLEAAAIDGANRVQRFARITFPLLAPFSFFLLVANVTYAFYGIYGAVDVLTQGGPTLGPGGIEGGATNVMIYNLYEDAFVNTGTVGLAAAQSVILFLLVAGITIFQFASIERNVTYGGD